MSFLASIILAAGKGTRMKSRLPKVLHRVSGKYMVEHVLDAVGKIGVKQNVVVIGHEAEMVREALGDRVDYAVQEQQLGTGHAVVSAMPCLKDKKGSVLVVCGDTPLLTAETLQELLHVHQESQSMCTVLTAKLTDPTGYGRIIRNEDDTVDRIVEQKDASSEELAVNEINTGTYCFDIKGLNEALATLNNNNAQGEYYLTDTVAYLAGKNKAVNTFIVQDFQETLGINSRLQLSEAENILRMRKLHQLMDEGVTIVDPDSTFIDNEVKVGSDTIIEPFTFLKGETTIGSECVIGPQSEIKNSIVGHGVQINRSVILESSVGDNCNVGPFAYLRPGTRLHNDVKIGDFVEIKNSTIGAGSKIPHLSYVGDAEIGQKVNIGAGSITCNYDGKNKYRTKINDGAFIGSNTNLVAPVEIGNGAITGAGSTITKDAPDNALAVARGKQMNLLNWAENKRKISDKKSEDSK